MTTSTSTPPSNEAIIASNDAEESVQTRRTHGANPGDLARRVNHRRTELGMSTEELAHEAGVDAWFLAYFQESADTNLSSGALLRLSVALQTTPLALQGGLIDESPGIGHAGSRPTLEKLSVDQCEKHLADGGIGRIVFTAGPGPVAVPMNFVFVDNKIIVRTNDSMALRIAGIVAFEVDRIDETLSEGWSVLVRGHARVSNDPETRRLVEHLDLEPWAGGSRHSLVVIAPFELTGRVITQQIEQDISTDQQSERGTP
jgi:nitroimidazol reductase NimA-like FMN-containing flavoprotein (pyridoxamine 5'-phosphate oxidase superfamily)